MAVTPPLVCYVIYSSPTDFPGWYVCRPQFIDEEKTFVHHCACLARNIEELRFTLEAHGLTAIPRFHEDDPKIVETWV